MTLEAYQYHLDTDSFDDGANAAVQDAIMQGIVEDDRV